MMSSSALTVSSVPTARTVAGAAPPIPDPAAPFPGAADAPPTARRGGCSLGLDASSSSSGRSAHEASGRSSRGASVADEDVEGAAAAAAAAAAAPAVAGRGDRWDRLDGVGDGGSDGAAAVRGADAVWEADAWASQPFPREGSAPYGQGGGDDAALQPHAAQQHYDMDGDVALGAEGHAPTALPAEWWPEDGRCSRSGAGRVGPEAWPAARHAAAGRGASSPVAAAAARLAAAATDLAASAEALLAAAAAGPPASGGRPLADDAPPAGKVRVRVVPGLGQGRPVPGHRQHRSSCKHSSP